MKYKKNQVFKWNCFGNLKLRVIVLADGDRLSNNAAVLESNMAQYPVGRVEYWIEDHESSFGKWELDRGYFKRKRFRGQLQRLLEESKADTL